MPFTFLLKAPQVLKIGESLGKPQFLALEDGELVLKDRESALTMSAVTVNGKEWGMKDSDAAFFQVMGKKQMWLSGSKSPTLTRNMDEASLYKINRSGDLLNLIEVGTAADVKKRSLNSESTRKLQVDNVSRWGIVYTEDEVPMTSEKIHVIPIMPLLVCSCITIVIIIFGMFVWWKWTPNPSNVFPQTFLKFMPFGSGGGANGGTAGGAGIGDSSFGLNPSKMTPGLLNKSLTTNTFTFRSATIDDSLKEFFN